MNKRKVLVFDAEQLAEDLLKPDFWQEEYEIVEADLSHGIHDQIEHFRPDIVILNLHDAVSRQYLQDMENHNGHKKRSAFRIGHLTVDLKARCVRLRNQRIQLTPTEFALLDLLTRNAGQVLTHEELSVVLARKSSADSHLLHVHISNLRRKIETNPSVPDYILTEPGIGYRLHTGEQWQ